MTACKGKLIAFEGIDRAGKTSVIERLPDQLGDCRVSIVRTGELRSPIAQAIRKMVNQQATAFLKTYFFASDRAWAYEAECLPALRRGDLVLWDRYVDSAIVYRTVELSRMRSRINLGFVKAINRPFKKADLTIYIDISEDVSAERARRAGAPALYDLEFLGEVRTQYLDLASRDKYCIINGERPIEEVVTEVAQIIRDEFKELFACLH